MNKQLLILGGHRKDGNTKAYASEVLSGQDYEAIDLLDYEIAHFNYQDKYPETDQYNLIVDKILTADHIIFATPVYWYSMSGRMKVLFDRLTDLVTVRKEIGRKLKGKSISVIFTSGSKSLNDGLENVFRETADYLDMNFVSCYHKHFD